MAETEQCSSSSANAKNGVYSLRILLFSPRSAARMKSRRPLTPAANTTTSPPPAAAGWGRTPQNTTETLHLTPREAFHSRTHTRTDQPSSQPAGSRVKMQRKLNSSSLKVAAKNKRLITAVFLSLQEAFFFALLPLDTVYILRRECSTGSTAVCGVHYLCIVCREWQCFLPLSAKKTAAVEAVGQRQEVKAEALQAVLRKFLNAEVGVVITYKQ